MLGKLTRIVPCNSNQRGICCLIRSNNLSLILLFDEIFNGELFDFITAKTRLREEEACRIFQQLIAGIEYIGELGIAHRDIKPENLLLDEFKNLRIVDFGLSNTYKQGEKLQTACGSPCYAAPELIRGKEYVGQKSDLWSAGVVLFAEVCGYLPFEDQNTQSLYQKILKADFRLPHFLSKDVKDLIMHILVPDPDLRFGIKQIKQHKWFNIYKPKKDISKGVRVGVDETILIPSLLKEMSISNGISEKLVKQSIQANRHNSITAHYYLLIKQKILNGDQIEDGINLQEDLCAVVEGKPSKSVCAPRSTKNGNQMHMRKIAEGLGDLNAIRMNRTIQKQLSDERSNEKQQRSPSLEMRTQIKPLRINPPTLQDPILPSYQDYLHQNLAGIPFSNNNLDQSLQEQSRGGMTNQSSLYDPKLLNQTNHMEEYLPYTQGLSNSKNRLKIKPKFKITTQHNKSLTSTVLSKKLFSSKTQSSARQGARLQEKQQPLKYFTIKSKEQDSSIDSFNYQTPNGYGILANQPGRIRMRGAASASGQQLSETLMANSRTATQPPRLVDQNIHLRNFATGEGKEQSITKILRSQLINQGSIISRPSNETSNLDYLDCDILPGEDLNIQRANVRTLQHERAKSQAGYNQTYQGSAQQAMNRTQIISRGAVRRQSGNQPIPLKKITMNSGIPSINYAASIYKNSKTPHGKVMSIKSLERNNFNQHQSIEIKHQNFMNFLGPQAHASIFSPMNNIPLLQDQLQTPQSSMPIQTRAETFQRKYLSIHGKPSPYVQGNPFFQQKTPTANIFIQENAQNSFTQNLNKTQLVNGQNRRRHKFNMSSQHGIPLQYSQQQPGVQQNIQFMQYNININGMMDGVNQQQQFNV